MQNAPAYGDLLSELHTYFQEKIEEAEQAGLERKRLILDPGLGFGKRMKDNLLILKEVESLSVFGCPLLLGYSRKNFTGKITGAKKTQDQKTQDQKTEDRLPETAAISALIEGRVQITRVHDVRENKRALLMARAIRNAP